MNKINIFNKRTGFEKKYNNQINIYLEIYEIKKVNKFKRKITFVKNTEEYLISKKEINKSFDKQNKKYIFVVISKTRANTFG